ncbi:MAG: two pore domain potassium channel family protein [Bacteroidales bacterium]|nr:two pore domain potassium channel family protein [Bacteroidales bacterium]
MKFSDKLKHFWHVVSNIRPIYWLSLYIALVPIFALIYWCIPHGQFRIPDGGSADYGGWLYYSIVTITTLGFGDYTPMGPIAQCVTAIEVMCGLIIIGFFLNAVGSMKSELDVTSELERQRAVHKSMELDKIIKNTPVFIHKLNLFLSFCYAVTTPIAKRGNSLRFNPEFKEEDLQDMNKHSGLPEDFSHRSAVENLFKCSSSLSLFIDSLQSRVDLSLWPELLEDCFSFVANYQMLSSDDPNDETNAELMNFIKTNALLARDIQTKLTEISTSDHTNN